MNDLIRGIAWGLVFSVPLIAAGVVAVLVLT